MSFATTAEISEKMSYVLDSPKDHGQVKLIVMRPAENERVELEQTEISFARGLHGDSWERGCWKKLPDGSPHPDVQICIMNSRMIEVIEADPSRYALAGDNLFLDFDLTPDNLMPGDQLSIGSAVIEITSQPHLGCKKFKARYGEEALAYLNSPKGKTLRLRGIYAKVVQDGVVSLNDEVTKR